MKYMLLIHQGDTPTPRDPEAWSRLSQDERNAVFAADAVARMTGIPGVAAVTAGPGVTNALTALKNAQLAQTPMVLFGGATATVLKGRGALQDIDQPARIEAPGEHLSLSFNVAIWKTNIRMFAGNRWSFPTNIFRLRRS